MIISKAAVGMKAAMGARRSGRILLAAVALALPAHGSAPVRRPQAPQQATLQQNLGAGQGVKWQQPSQGQGRHSSAAAAGQEDQAKWQQDAFWISFWVGPQVGLDELDERVAEVAECNFTGYLGFNGDAKGPYHPGPARVAKEIELCDKHGLRCVPSLCDVECCGPVNTSSGCLELGRTSKNFWGYQLLDESNYPDSGAGPIPFLPGFVRVFA